MVSVVIDSSKCKGNGSCVDVCPVAVFQLDNANSKCLVVNQNDCILCEACVTQCPAQAITVSE